MATVRVCLALVFCSCAVHLNVKAYRLTRSPDRMEVEFPEYSADGSQEVQNRADNEADYWDQERVEYGDRGESDYEKGEKNREKNQEKNEDRYEEEKKYQDKQQETNNNNAENRYNDDKEYTEAAQQAGEEHYGEQEQDSNGEYYESEGEKSGSTAGKFTDDNAQRYEDKEMEDMSNREDRMENYDVEGNNPSIKYDN